MQLRRELAYDHLQKANKFIEKAEMKKEAEIKRWREKNLVRMSPKLHPQRPDAIETSKSKKSRGKGKKGSMWKIDNCLTASDYTDRRPGRSTNSTAANKRPSDRFDNAAILKVILNCYTAMHLLLVDQLKILLQANLASV